MDECGQEEVTIKTGEDTWPDEHAQKDVIFRDPGRIITEIGIANMNRITISI